MNTGPFFIEVLPFKERVKAAARNSRYSKPSIGALLGNLEPFTHTCDVNFCDELTGVLGNYEYSEVTG